MARRRANGEGTIHQRKSDGRWVVMMTVGVRENGRPARVTRYAKDREDAGRILTELHGLKLQGGLVAPSHRTVGEYMRAWLEDSKRPNIRPTTHRVYENAIRNHIGTTIGGMRLSRIQPATVQGMLRELERREVSGRSRQIVLRVLSQGLDQAVRWGEIPRNPCALVDRPRAERREIQALTVEQVRAFLAAARSDRYYALWVLALTTGMRIGELLGLKWSDIDLDTGRLEVKRQLQELPSSIELTELKTRRSRRRIELSGIAVAALREHRAQLGAIPLPDVLVFTDRRGGPLRRSNLTRRSFQDILDRAELPRIRLHGLRHTAATLQLSQGAHPKVVQEMLGHASIALTLDTYSHSVPSLQREAASRMDEILRHDANTDH